MSEPIDFLKQPIKVGDTVIWSDAGGRGGSMSLNKSTVKRITPKQVVLEETTWNITRRPFNCVVVIKEANDV